MPRNDFVRVLRHEMRRADRTRAPLTMVLLQLDEQLEAQHGEPARSVLLEVLAEQTRETDAVGHVFDGRIVVLCPDTDEKGAQSVARKLQDAAGALLREIGVLSYPDHLFEQIGGEGVPAAASANDAVMAMADERREGYRLKRALDLVGAALALVGLLPLMLIAAIGVRLSSPGPILFRQTRLGRGGVPFTFWKFRSMRVDTDDAIHRNFVADLIAPGEGSARDGNTLPASGSAPYKLQADPRVTPFGRLLRRSSIDELPQLFNVLRGEMSLVGPRPPIAYEAAHYQSWHLRRILLLKPGITGLWQVQGRSRVSFNEMVRMDIRYVNDCSLWLDLRILARTLLVVVRGDGAR